MKYEPANGSTVSVAPDSWAMICCVRSAIRAARSVGSASASSKPLVCSDCAPPHTAAKRGPAARGGEALRPHARDVVLRLLGGERHAAGLRVEAQHQRLRALGPEALL